MALFSSHKKTTIPSKKIRPTVIRTKNVAKELMNIAKSYEISVDKLDFNLLEVQTYTRMNDGEKETDWEEVTPDELYELDDVTALLNSNFQIKQMYEIEIFSKNENEKLYENFHLAVGANATKCKVYLSVKEGSNVKYNPRFEKELLVLINKRKMRAGILINIFDEMLDDVVSKISAYVRIEEEVTYTKNETILIAESFEPTLTTDDALILHYDKKEKITDDDKIDYASRGFIQNVTKDELLIEYIKPKEGKPGRNCRGEFMKPTEPILNNEITFSVDDTISIVEDDDTIRYIAHENGYIALEDNKYTIKTEVDVGEISFKTTGCISTGLDSEVSISVKEADAIKDAVGSGMNVEVSEIYIEGNVGSNATVNALKATIDGQVHKTAKVKADNLKINVHKGSAYGKNIDITRLEHGSVNGDNVEISQAIGGDVRGREVVVEVCGSYVNITASKLIEIRKLQGNENKFTIDPLLKKDAQTGLDKNKKDIVLLKKSLNVIKKDIQKYTILIKENTKSFNDVKKRLIHYKKNGVKMPETFVKKYKQFQKMQEHLKFLQKDYEDKNDQLELLTTRTLSFQDNILDARIINRDRWVGYNTLVFKLVNPPIEITYKPQEGSLEKVFGLVEVEDGEYEIQAVKE